MITKRLLALPIVLVGLVVAACSSSSGSSSPNKTPGQCVLSNGTWYCGGEYGNYPDCVWEAGTDLIGASCDNKGVVCFSCYYESAGIICSCSAGDAGGLTWHCPYPSGTGCMSQ